MDGHLHLSPTASVSIRSHATSIDPTFSSSLNHAVSALLRFVGIAMRQFTASSAPIIDRLSCSHTTGGCDCTRAEHAHDLFRVSHTMRHLGDGDLQYDPHIHLILTDLDGRTELFTAAGAPLPPRTGFPRLYFRLTEIKKSPAELHRPTSKLYW